MGSASTPALEREGEVEQSESTEKNQGCNREKEPVRILVNEGKLPGGRQGEEVICIQH